MARPRPSRRAAILSVMVPLTLTLTACGAASSTPAAADSSASAAGTGSAGPSTAGGTPATASATTSPEGSGCGLPVHIGATVARTQIIDLQVEAQDGSDRVVYTFSAGLPEVTLQRATPPFTQDASGAPLRVEGTDFLRLVLNGGTVQLPAGGVSYNGAVSMTPRFERLVDLQSGGDFEAVSSWYLGVSAATCVRVSTLEAPSRLVIEIGQ